MTGADRMRGEETARRGVAAMGVGEGEAWLKVRKARRERWRLELEGQRGLNGKEYAAAARRMRRWLARRAVGERGRALDGALASVFAGETPDAALRGAQGLTYKSGLDDNQYFEHQRGRRAR